RIEKIKENLRIEKRQAYRVQQEARNDDRLSDEHEERLAQVRKDNQQSRQDLADIVRDYGATSGLDSIARTDDEVAEGEQRRKEARRGGQRKSRKAIRLHGRCKSLDTRKVEIISGTGRSVIRKDQKKAAKIRRHENIQLGGCLS